MRLADRGGLPDVFQDVPGCWPECCRTLATAGGGWQEFGVDWGPSAATLAQLVRVGPAAVVGPTARFAVPFLRRQCATIRAHCCRFGREDLAHAALEPVPALGRGVSFVRLWPCVAHWRTC